MLGSQKKLKKHPLGVKDGKSTIRSRRSDSITAIVVVCLILLAVLLPIGMAIKSRVDSADPYAYFGQHLSDPKEASNIKLTDQDGNSLELKSLRGDLVLLTFGFTHCANVCPMTLSNLAALDRKLPPDIQKRVKVLFVSVDPQRDNPKTLKDYMPFFDPNFIGLTGTSGDIATVAKSYGVYYKKSDDPGPDPADYMVNHSTYTYLIDPAGKLRVLYRFENMPNTDGLVRDIRHVLDLFPKT